MSHRWNLHPTLKCWILRDASSKRRSGIALFESHQTLFETHRNWHCVTVRDAYEHSFLNEYSYASRTVPNGSSLLEITPQKRHCKSRFPITIWSFRRNGTTTVNRRPAAPSPISSSRIYAVGLRGSHKWIYNCYILYVPGSVVTIQWIGKHFDSKTYVITADDFAFVVTLDHKLWLLNFVELAGVGNRILQMMVEISGVSRCVVLKTDPQDPRKNFTYHKHPIFFMLGLEFGPNLLSWKILVPGEGWIWGIKKVFSIETFCKLCENHNTEALLDFAICREGNNVDWVEHVKTRLRLLHVNVPPTLASIVDTRRLRLLTGNPRFLLPVR